MQGDTLYTLARRYDTTVAELKRINNLFGDTIHVQQSLLVPALTPAPAQPADQESFPRVTLGAGDDLLQLALRYGVSPGELARANNLARLSDARIGQVIVIPQASDTGRGGAAPAIPIVTSAPRVTAAASPVPSPTLSLNRQQRLLNQQVQLLGRAATIMGRYEPPSPFYSWPLIVQGRITSLFGARTLTITSSRFHYGLDIASPTGTEILAAKRGTVTRASWVGSYGYAVFIDHGDGTETRYAHMSQLLVREGQSVEQGKVIGYVGSTGLSTGPHLHFELRVDGRAVDPLPYIQQNLYASAR